MDQATVNRAVARATGESVSFVKRMGFSLVPLPTAACRRRQRNRHRAPTNLAHLPVYHQAGRVFCPVS
jgi:hypothetical protein